MNRDKINLVNAVKDRAEQEGFAVCAIAPAAVSPQTAARFRAWLDAGRHGEMIWMESRSDERSDPKTLWNDVRSVIMLGMSYAPGDDPMALADAHDHARISVYARGRDYHDRVKGALKRLAGWLVQQNGGDVKVFVDTAPVMEKALAEAAGLGWQGKHTNIVSRDHGSWLFLGAIYTSADLPAGTPLGDHCGSCNACQDICPTKAFPAPYQLDARRCISYLTIEHKGPIPHDLRAGIGNHIYGCDDCLAVCPWNKFAQSAATHKAFHPRAELTAPEISDLLTLDDAAFRALFSGSPVKRTGRDRFIRNVLIAAGNSGKPALSGPVTALLGDPSAVVRGAAIWALAHIDRPAFAAEKQARLSAERDPDVAAEWNSF
ncbi:tRNA epoxyqueuosine(34) reductase QueG [Sphingorhabdus arenilitoris]|uniref:Epoxyqueuosine reductase n=1 Tax=Sphingorhabdus arenilitoris TaxID=1490041 RepID=A0ABV8RKK6_9SPHN